MIYWVHLVCSFLVRVLPPGQVCTLLDLCAPLVAWLWPAHRRRAERNLERVLGPDADRLLVRKTVHNVFRNYARYMLDLVRLPYTDLRQFEREAVVHGREHFDQAMAAGRGVVLASGHIGSWDLAAAWLAAQGHRVNVPVETLKPERWNEQVQKLRRAAGLNAIPMERGVRQMLRVLRKNEILGLLVDRPLAQEGIPVLFFGAATHVPAGAAKLALKTGATLLATAAVREAGRPTIFVSPPLRVDSSGDEARDAQALTQQLMAWLEALIRRYPDQWYMFRDMWPAGEQLVAESTAPGPAVGIASQSSGVGGQQSMVSS
ncbi:MAG: lysophospholipid acyltransferase family protein [Chloroflexi bacterium]|nr:lysophospholipid acyltransferase family protein [Chloroflexota bacterium]